MADASPLAAAQSILANTPIGKPDVAGKTHAELLKASKDFEAVFISQMFGIMTKDIPTDGPFGGGAGEGMMRSLLNDQYAKAIVAHGGFGLSDNVYRELLAYQEGSSHAGPSTPNIPSTKVSDQ